MIVPRRNKQLVVALLIYSETRGYVHHAVRDVCEHFRIAHIEGLVDLMVEQLVEGGYLISSERLIDEPTPELVFEPTIKLTGKGLTSAEFWRSSVEDEFSIPAANRYVSLSDNRRTAIAEALSALRASVEAVNDCDDNDRQIALAEIALFEQTIAQPRVPVELLERFATFALKWIAIAFVNAAVGQAANDLLVAIRPALMRNLAA
jgi:hypothetical protein